MTTHAAVAYLAERGLVETDAVRFGASVEIVAATTDSAATRGSMAWVSQKALAAEPDKLRAFEGSFLILPAEAAAHVSDVPAAATVVPCGRPKLAFSMLATHLFAEDAAPGWPVGAEPHGATGARLGQNVRLAPGVVLGAGVTIGDNVRIGPNTCIARTTIADNVDIGANCSIGLAGFGYDRAEDGELFRFPHLGGVVIESGVSIGSNVCIDRGALGNTVVGAGSKIDNLVHVAHNVVIGRQSLVIANAMIGGSTTIGDRVWVAPSAALINKISLADDTVVGMGAVVLRSTEQGAVVVGNPARPLPKKS